MGKERDIIRLRTMWGAPVQIGQITVTPQSQVLAVRWPTGGIIWNRPVAVLVRSGNQTRRIPIVDVTRVIQLSLWLFGTILGVALVSRSRSKRNDSTAKWGVAK